MNLENGYKEDFIISPEYLPVCNVYSITPPAIESGYVYHFSTPSGLDYEVRFAPKADDILGMVVNFTVLGDDFEQDYPVTNRGEMYCIIATVVVILMKFHFYHNFTKSYEFSGEFKDNEVREDQKASIRTRLYVRQANRVLNNNWKAFISGNRAILKRIN